MGMAHHIPRHQTVAGSSSAQLRAISTTMMEPFLKPLIPERAPDFNKRVFIRWLEAGAPLNR